MDYKVKLTNCQNEHHHGGIFETWTKWAKPQANWAQGPVDRPNSLPGWPGFEMAWARTWLTRLYVGSQGRIRGSKAVEAEMSGRPSTWMVGWPSICSKPTLPSRWRLPSAPI
jgi:hypothetical protein